jgi:protein-disulfide isomerase
VSKKNRQRKFGSGEAASQGGSGMGRIYWILGIVLVLGIGIIGYSVGSTALSSTATEPVPVEGLDDPQRLMEMARGVVRGNPDAPITILEFADFQCPGCAQFARDVKPTVDAEFVEPGTARFVFYDFPLVSIHPNAFLAARAGRCAEDQDRFWDYHDQLFRFQPRWSASGNPAGLFEEYAREIGLDTEAFSSCLRSSRHAELVTANMELGYQLQVQGTPTVMVTRGRGMGQRVAGSPEAIREAVARLQAGG